MSRTAEHPPIADPVRPASSGERDGGYPRGEFGALMMERGDALVANGVTMDQLVWDADEVLWDWAMSAARLAAFAPRRALRRDLGHREYVLVKPGIIELLVGMHRASLARGLDARLRIWTNGYPWRLWRIGREIPGFLELLGLPSTATPEQVRDHPTVFARPDYARAAGLLVQYPARRDALADMSPRARRVLEEHLVRTPLDSTLKVPELASLAGKDGFSSAAYLVDDYGNNIKRFVASGRRGVRVLNWTPVLLSRVPNTVWHKPFETLQRAHTTVAGAIADALMALSERPAPDSVSVASNGRAADPALQLVIDIPDARLRAEWLEPMQALKATLR